MVALNVSNLGPPSSGPLAIDASASADGRGTLSSSLQVPHGGDLLLAFVTADGPSGGQTATVSGGGLAWSLVRRANGRLGTSEVWKANGPAKPGAVNVTSTPNASGYDQSITVIAFSGSGGVGASSAASARKRRADCECDDHRNGSWVFGAGNDWDGAVGAPSAPAR